ncbi:MAG: DUF4280 domain-containing protein [Polyangia bacterium]
MGMPLCNGSLLQCSFGAAPSAMVVIPVSQVLMKQPAATIMDHVPMMNIMPFGACAAPPMVMTPVCVPATPAPWVPGAPTVLLGGKPALDSNSMLMCAMGGVIKPVLGEPTVKTP